MEPNLDLLNLMSHVGTQLGRVVERKQVEKEAERSLQRMRLLQEIDHAVTTSLELPVVLELLLDKIETVLPFAAVTIRLLDKKSGLLEPVACRNLPMDEWKAADLHGGRGIPKIVFETKKPWGTLDVQGDSRVQDSRFFRKHGLVSYSGVPLLVKDEGIGVLGFYAKRRHDFGEEAEFLITLGGQAAVAIHNSQPYEEIRGSGRAGDPIASRMSF